MALRLNLKTLQGEILVKKRTKRVDIEGREMSRLYGDTGTRGHGNCYSNEEP